MPEKPNWSLTDGSASACDLKVSDRKVPSSRKPYHEKEWDEMSDEEKQLINDRLRALVNRFAPDGP